MKFKKNILLLLICLIPFIIHSQVKYPKPVSFVNDFAGLISDEVRIQLENLLTELKQKSDVEIAVVTVKDMQGLDRETYAVELFKEWKIGSKNDEGILFLIAESERQIKIEVGYGLEGLINDAKAGRILDNYALPSLKENDFNNGIKNTVIALCQVIAADKNIQLTGMPDVQHREIRKRSGLSNLIFIIIFIFLMIVTRGKILLWLLLFSGHGGGRGGGFGGGGGGFGGFGGFGGGSSGGGGAGRSF